MGYTSEDIRRADKRTSDRNICRCCELCGEHAWITEVHHLVPLKEYAKSANEGRLEFEEIPIAHLCPNCHSYFHLLTTENPSRRTIGKIGGMMGDADSAWVEKMYGLIEKSTALKDSIFP